VREIGTYPAPVPTWLSDLRRWLTTYKGVSPWPTTVAGWLEGAWEMQGHLRDAAIEVADEIGAPDLVERMRAEPAQSFPADRYLAELNERRRGAGDDAVKRAGRRLRG
jgi:hypothetical protein